MAVTDWRLRRWRLWFLALMTATRLETHNTLSFQVVLWIRKVLISVKEIVKTTLFLREVIFTYAVVWMKTKAWMNMRRLAESWLTSMAVRQRFLSASGIESTTEGFQWVSHGVSSKGVSLTDSTALTVRPGGTTQRPGVTATSLFHRQLCPIYHESKTRLSQRISSSRRCGAACSKGYSSLRGTFLRIST